MVAWKRGLFPRILGHYGPRCVQCGFDNPLALVVDHVKDDGHLHRKQVGNTPYGVYADIVRRGFPPDFQILCANCNTIKLRLTYAMHNQEDK